MPRGRELCNPRGCSPTGSKVYGSPLSLLNLAREIFMLKLLGGTIGVIFLIGLAVVVLLLMLIF
jgi:hypothetical protein